MNSLGRHCAHRRMYNVIHLAAASHVMGWILCTLPFSQRPYCTLPSLFLEFILYINSS